MLPNQPVRTRQPRPIMTAIKNPCSCSGGGGRAPAVAARNPVSFVGGGGSIGPAGATGGGVSSGMSPSNSNQITFRTWNNWWPWWGWGGWPYSYAYYPYAYPAYAYSYPWPYAYGWSGWPGYYGAPWPYAPRVPVVAAAA